jgi:hypothetical protein
LIDHGKGALDPRHDGRADHRSGADAAEQQPIAQGADVHVPTDKYWLLSDN